MAWIVLDGGSNARNVHVDGSIEGLERFAAHKVHQLFARQHPPGTFRKRDQQFELVRRQRANLTIDPYEARVAVDSRGDRSAVPSPPARRRPGAAAP